MNDKEKYVRIRDIPEDKTKLVDELAEKMKTSNTVLIASMKSLPSSHFNEIKKNFRGKADVKVAKKSMVFRAIEKTEKGALQGLKKILKADFVLFFSDLDAFELSGMLSDNQSPAKAKTGDIAPYDLEIEAGMTDLLPGPAISELGSVGLKVKVTNGKLEIIKGAVIVKEGEVITEAVAGVLAKLGVVPMKVGFTPVAAYDAKSDQIYLDIKIDKPGVLEEMKDLIKKALGFAINMEYPTDKTIVYFIAKAGTEEKALENLVGKKEVKEEEAVEEKKEETKEVKEEITEAPVEEVKEKPVEKIKVEKTKAEDVVEEKQEENKDV